MLLLATALLCQTIGPALSAQRAPQTSGPGVPDIVLVILDDYAAVDRLTTPTPNIDRIAAEGFTFERAYSMPVCAATRRSLWFGIETARHFGPGCGTQQPNLPRPPFTDPELFQSLPARLHQRGYASALFGKWHSGQATNGWQLAPLELGFDRWIAGSPPSTRSCQGEGYQEWVRIEDGLLVGVETGYATSVQGAATRKWMAGHLFQPRFAALSFNAPHEPMQPPPASALPVGYPPPNIFDPPRRIFRAMVAAADLEIGRLYDSLDLERTIIILIGDNGTPPEAAHPTQDPARVKRSVYEGGVRVPMIIAGAGIPRGVSSALVHTTDLYATIALWAGSPKLNFGASRPLQPLLRNPAREIRDHLYVGHVRHNQVEEAIVTRAGWKLHRRGSPATFELYHVLDDPTEENPLPLDGRNGPLVDKLKRLLP